jgi:YVTN family beta-propeller protein
VRPATGVVLALAAAVVGAPAPVAAASLTLEARIPLGALKGRIDHLAVDREGRRLFVAELGNDTVGVVDLRAGKVVHRITGLEEPQGVAWDPGTRTLWVANARDGSVRIFGGDTFEPTGRIDLGDDADNVRISGGQVFVGYGAGAIAIIDPASKRVMATLHLGAHPEGFQVDPGTGKAFVNVPNHREVAVLDLHAGTQAASLPTERFRANFPMVLVDGGGLAVVTRQPSAILRYTADGVQAWTAPTCADADDVFFDRRRLVFYVSCGDGAVAVQADRKDAPLERVQTAPGARTSLFSPEFDRLFVAAPARGGQAEILVLKRSKD